MSKKRNSYRDTVLFIVGLVSVGLFTIAVISTFVGNVPGNVQSTEIVIQASQVDEIAKSASVDTLAPLEQNEATATPSPSPPEETAASSPTVIPVTITPTAPDTPVPHTGTVEVDQYLIVSGKKANIDAQSGFAGMLGDVPVHIMTGSKGGDPSQGVVHLIVQFRLPLKGVVEHVFTPTKHGAIRIVSEQNNRLTLVSTDGTMYYFDIPARQFVDSLTEVVPTATLLPTVTPFPTPPPTVPSPTPLPTVNPYP